MIRLLQTGEVTELSLDHDLGDDEHGTGYTVILWLEEAVGDTRVCAAGDYGSYFQRVRAAEDAGGH